MGLLSATFDATPRVKCGIVSSEYRAEDDSMDTEEGLHVRRQKQSHNKRGQQACIHQVQTTHGLAEPAGVRQGVIDGPVRPGAEFRQEEADQQPYHEAERNPGADV